MSNYPDNLNTAALDRATSSADRPTPDQLRQWVKEAASWATFRLALKFKTSEFAAYGDFDALCLVGAIEDGLSDAVYDASVELES